MFLFVFVSYIYFVLFLLVLKKKKGNFQVTDSHRKNPFGFHDILFALLWNAMRSTAYHNISGGVKTCHCMKHFINIVIDIENSPEGWCHPRNFVVFWENRFCRNLKTNKVKYIKVYIFRRKFYKESSWIVRFWLKTAFWEVAKN